MDKRLDLDLPVRGELDTAMPISDRPRGTLVEAKDVDPRRWGPKRGHLAFTRIGEGPGTAALYDEITLVNNATFARTREDAARDLGTQFTLDLWFRLTDVAYAAGQNVIGLYSFAVGSTGMIEVNIRGPAHADHERIKVDITTSSSRTVAGTAITFTGATRISVGSNQRDKHHVRVVRDGANATLYLDGVSDGSSSALSATQPIYGDFGSLLDIRNGRTSTSGLYSFKGQIFGSILRDGAFATQPIEAVMPSDPWARNVHHYYLGRSIAMGGDVHMMDAGRFGLHGCLDDLTVGTYSVAAANDEAAPAPMPIQGLRTWTTRTNRTATSCVAAGVLSTVAIG